MRAVFLSILLFLSTPLLAQEVNRPMQDTLKEVTIKSQSVKRVLHSAKEFVVDYSFVDGYILVASYSSPNQKDPKLFLLTRMGDTASIAHLPEAPSELYKSCGGKWYCVTDDVLYPLDIDTGNLQISGAYSLSVYDELRICQYATQDVIYYGFFDRRKWDITYAYAKNGKDELHTVLHFDDRQTRIGKETERKFPLSAGASYLLDRNAFRYLNQPLFWESNRIVAFDFRTKRIVKYDLEGNLLESAPFHLSFTNVQRLEIIQDPVTREYYLHRSDNPAQQTLERINMQTGELYTAIPIEKPFISKLKVFDGEIYYLFQDSAEPTTQQLFVQRGF
ncbi:hypothetical protein [Taibaiella soli]|uniref:DUF5050 domain-containing protein n=1 Tax=Taibaiella soli TaxID=1649169 RepID=A0A2W2BLH7_9BACT|nr:hypothetical protein [Taibaiella soli]PZF74286.1 hypothetical protein DN068_04565 [Taibaiella soli]